MDPISRKAKAFWDSRQKAATPGQLTGYLLDESPPSIGRHRFEGEWAQARPWLDGRGACLDVGCGTGIWLRALAAEFKTAEGWDYSPAMAAASRRTLKEAGIRNAAAHCGQVTQRKGSAVFDLIFVGGVVMYNPDTALKPLLKSLVRLLKPGGLLLLRETTCREGSWIRQGVPLRPGLLATGAEAQEYVAVYRAREALRAELRAAGLEVRAVRPNPHYKLSDLTEDRLRWMPFAKSRPDQVAEWLYRTRWLALYPEHFVRRILGLWPWKLENDWYLCYRRT